MENTLTCILIILSMLFSLVFWIFYLKDDMKDKNN